MPTLHGATLEATNTYFSILRSKYDRNSIAFSFLNALEQKAINEGFEISENTFVANNRIALENAMHVAIHRKNQNRTYFGQQVEAVFNIAQQIEKADREENRNKFQNESASGLSYLQLLQISPDLVNGMMLDTEALNDLLQKAKLPENVGYHIAQRQNGKELNQVDLGLIQNQLDGKNENPFGNNAIKPKDFVIVISSQDNAHFYVNLYKKNSEGIAEKVYSQDSDYAMGNNTCGISAVIKGLQMAAEKNTNYDPSSFTHNVEPTSKPEVLSAWSNATLLNKEFKWPQEFEVEEKHQLPEVKPEEENDIIQAQAELFGSFFKSKKPEDNAEQKWHEIYDDKKNAELKKQYDADRTYALQVAKEEMKQKIYRPGN